MSEIAPVLTESAIIAILRGKHARDLFIDHCKTGPTYSGGSPILDAWVMPFSWTRPIIGYEIKISRGDFRRDRKWFSYLQYCNLFYFVCPHELIQPDEVGEHAGLIWISKTGRALRYKKRPAFRGWHQIPSSIFQYALMWRTGNSEPANKEPEV